MPSASFSHTVSVASPVREVWARLQRAETWENIGPVDSVWDAFHNESGELQGYSWGARVGPTRYEGTAVVLESAPPSFLKLDLDAKEVAGELGAVLESIGATTTLTVNLTVRSVGTLSALFFPVVAQAVGNGLPEQVERFASSAAG